MLIYFTLQSLSGECSIKLKPFSDLIYSLFRFHSHLFKYVTIFLLRIVLINIGIVMYKNLT